MRKINLNQLMLNLYKNLDYFASIPTDKNYRSKNQFEIDYHKITIDPDGKKRSLLEERDYSLSQMKEFTDFLDNMKPGKILDFGCGLGWLLSYLDDNWNKHGIEISTFATNHASKFGKIYNRNYQTYTEVDFDIITMNQVIEHLPDPCEVIKKIYKMLKPKGYFLIGTPDFDSAAARRYGDKFRLLDDPTHISLFSCDSMHRFLRDHNFRIIKVEYPYFDTPFFSKNNLLKLLDNKGVSPPFYGSMMTFFCEKG
jgi:SAM-dependent methyltransferase